MRFLVNSSTRLASVAAGVIFSTMAVAQPLTFSVNPATGGAGTSYPGQGYGVNPTNPPPGVTLMGYTQDGWLKMPADGLHYIGPRYAQPSGVKLRRGSPVPGWIDTGAMESVSVPGLTSGARYGYFISPDQKIVVVDPQSRRVMRVMR